MARPMAYDSVSPQMPLRPFSVMPDMHFIPALFAIPALSVIPELSVIPAQAGIQRRNDIHLSSSTRLDTRLRGYDGIGCCVGLVDSGEVGGDGV